MSRGPSAFFDRCKQTVGAAPMEYLLHWRMVLAKDMLRRREVTIADPTRDRIRIGAQFSVAFGRHVGVPLSRYAREIAA